LLLGYYFTVVMLLRTVYLFQLNTAISKTLFTKDRVRLKKVDYTVSKISV